MELGRGCEGKPMDHSEAVQEMIAEKYLLDELTPEERDAFEEHLFDCAECALDVRAGAAFVEEAKVQLPGLTVEAAPASPGRAGESKKGEKKDWLRWWRPFFASPAIVGPVFAALLIVVGYQNFVTLPALRTAATEPRLLPPVALHGATRDGEAVKIEAERGAGVVLLVEVPVQPGFDSYSFDLFDPQGKLAWTRNLTAAAVGADGDTLSLVIPGAGLLAGTYSLRITGNTAVGQHTELERRSLAIHFPN